MRYNQLGNSGLFVSELCLGTMTFGAGTGFWKNIGQVGVAEAETLIGRAMESGVNFIDTADVYSDGDSEKITGQALKNLNVKRSDVVVATKVYNRFGNGANDRGASRGHIMDGIKGSLSRLGLDYVDLYQIHGLDIVTPIEETVRALDDLVRQGLVRYVGVSNWPAWQIMKAIGIAHHRGWARPEAVQAYYTIAGRDLEREVIPLLEDQKVGLLVWSPLAGGLLSGKFRRDGDSADGESRRKAFDFPPVNRELAWKCLDVMEPIALAHRVSVARVAIAWLLKRACVTSVIVGARNLNQLNDNLGAVAVKLSAEELAQLDEVSALVPEYPGWMVERLSRDRRPVPFGTAPVSRW
jgi:aryl-alcohol dehydrogenase-like predicted oxidoreductase